MHTRHLTASALLATALVLTGCGNGGNDTATAPGSGTSAAGTAQGNDADLAFLTGMKPHHEQAVEMSELVLAADPPADVAALAQRVKDAQSPEIEQMDEMLTALGEDVDGMTHSGGHSGGMAGHGGMMSDSDMEALMGASGADAARLYLEGMIEHHEGAIEASDAQIADGQYEPAVELAEQIKAAQEAEIAEMETLLGEL